MLLSKIEFSFLTHQDLYYSHRACSATQSNRVVAKRFIPATHTEGGLGRAKGASPVRIPTWNTTYYCTVVADALFQ